MMNEVLNSEDENCSNNPSDSLQSQGSPSAYSLQSPPTDLLVNRPSFQISPSENPQELQTTPVHPHLMALLTLHQQMQCLQYLVGFGGTELQRQLENFYVQAVQEFTQLRDRLATANVSSSEKFTYFSEWAHRVD